MQGMKQRQGENSTAKGHTHLRSSHTRTPFLTSASRKTWESSFSLWNKGTNGDSQATIYHHPSDSNQQQWPSEWQKHVTVLTITSTSSETWTDHLPARQSECSSINCPYWWPQIIQIHIIFIFDQFSQATWAKLQPSNKTEVCLNISFRQFRWFPCGPRKNGPIFNSFFSRWNPAHS